MSLDDFLSETSQAAATDANPSIFDLLSKNLRVNIDFVSRVDTSSRRREPGFLGALGLDMRKVWSDDEGDIGTMVLQPYIVRRDNQYDRPLAFDGNDKFIIELHDFYFNYTRGSRGRANIKFGHFDVPFGLEPLVDTHFTLRQLIPMFEAGFKKDWGVSLNGVMPKFDYELSITRGTGIDLTVLNHEPYLFAGRIGTPSDQNTIIGISALYGEVIDEHGAHRVDEADSRGDFREVEGFVRRWRVGADVTHLVNVWTLRGEFSGGQDFDQEVYNAIGELSWTNPEETFTAYFQAIYLGQDGHLGYDADVWSKIIIEWKLNQATTLSASWRHEFETYIEETGGLHTPEDYYLLQLRLRF